VITKALAKADYTGKQAHVELAVRMKQRDAGSAPALGDRVAYVIIKEHKGKHFISCGLKRPDGVDTHLQALRHMKSRRALYVLDNNIPIDTKYYLDNQLANPLMRIFEPILGEKASSLCKEGFLGATGAKGLRVVAVSGDHTRTIQIATPTAGGLMKFAVKTRTCLGCKTALKPTDSIPGEYLAQVTSED